MNKRVVSVVAGAGILLAVGGVVLVASDPRVGPALMGQQVEQVALRGDVGGEKIEFLRDPEVMQILKDRHGVTVDARRAGSLAMARAPGQGADFIWPAHDTAADLFRERGGVATGEDNVFSSPVVVLSWAPVTEALEKRGLVARRDGTYYIVDLRRLMDDVRAEVPWASLGLPQLSGAVSVVSTHPAASNSGATFAALVATVFNEGRTPTPADMDRVGPDVRRVFERLGRMEDSSGRIFRQFLTQGMGSFPLMVAYENQLIEHWDQAPEAERTLLTDRVRVLYPVPTAWATHPLLALTPKGRRLVEALRDPAIRRIAWTRHGFRLPGDGGERPAAAARLGMPETVTGVVRMPSTAAFERMLDRFIPEN